MKTKKRYKSVSDLVESLTDDVEFKEELEQETNTQSMAKTLFAMRCAQGITQAEMAKRVGCTQGRLSKLEHSDNDSIKLGDLTAYAEALALNVSISFHKEVSAVESVKYHAFQIKKHLDHLAKLAYRDDQIFIGVKDFYNEYLFNIIKLFKESAENLPKVSNKKGRSVLDISVPRSEIDVVNEAHTECCIR